MRRGVPIAAAAAAAALVVAALVALGRYEGASAAERENRGLAALRAEIGPSLDAPTLTSYRRAEHECLLYAVGRAPFAIQLCYDAEGRLVEAADRRAREPTYWNLAYDPRLATVRDDPDEIDRLIEKIQAALDD